MYCTVLFPLQLSDHMMYALQRHASSGGHMRIVITKEAEWMFPPGPHVACVLSFSAAESPMGGTTQSPKWHYPKLRGLSAPFLGCGEGE